MQIINIWKSGYYPARPPQIMPKLCFRDQHERLEVYKINYIEANKIKGIMLKIDNNGQCANAYTMLACWTSFDWGRGGVQTSPQKLFKIGGYYFRVYIGFIHGTDTSLRFIPIVKTRTVESPSGR
jgi:hypothetical protein